MPPSKGRDQATSQLQELATKAAYFLPSFDQADGQCEVTCNTEEVDTASVSSTSEPRTCVGTLKVRRPYFRSGRACCHQHTCHDSDVKLLMGPSENGWSVQVFCTGNSTSGLSVAGLKCEGKSTLFEGTAICEGSLQNFVKKGFKTPEGKFIKSTKAYGCLGTSIGLSFNSSSNSAHAVGFKSADALAVETALAGDLLQS